MQYKYKLKDLHLNLLLVILKLQTAMNSAMKNLFFLSLLIISLISQSCNKHDPIPDYASKLVGDFDIAYLLVDLNTKEVASSDLGTSKFAKINLKRKSNQYLTATVTIDDSTTKFTDTFELVVSESADQTEVYGKPGFLASYNVGSIASNVIYYSNWNLYEDGSLIGFIQYGNNESIKRFAVGTNID